ncbi:MAG: choice-of-anchor Q domain-containing protein [Myxococcota bacterium]
MNPLAGYDWDSPPADHLVTSAADDGSGSLRQVLADAADGEVVGFDPALAGETIALETELQVGASVTLDGTGAPGVTLDGQGATRILTVAKGRDTTFVGLRFVGGSTTGPGGAIHVGQSDEGQPKGSVAIIGCAFERNIGGRGGAVRVGWRINALVRDSVFVENDGSGGSEDDRGFSGGAISTSQSGELIVQRCRFDRNVGWNGGAIYNILQPLVIEDSVFIDNEGASGEGGGAIFTDGGNPAGPGNDPQTGVEGQITLRRLWVEGSRGAGYGGALLLWGYPRDVITIESSVFRDNTCDTGNDGSAKGGVGRIHALDRMTIRDTVFAGNRTVQQGGALWIDGSGPFEMINATFSGNVVEDDAGGAFNYNGQGPLTIESSAFVENHAGRACGAFWYGNADLDVTVRNTVFALNTAGDIDQRNVSFQPNDGGGILEFAVEQPDRGRVSPDSLFADPLLGDLTPTNGTLLHPLMDGSPAIGAAGASAPDWDARAAERDGEPDIGPYEADATCQP